MGKWQNDTVLDQALTYVKTNMDSGEIWVLNTSATDMTTASAAKLAETVTASGDFTLANGSATGRSLVYTGASGVTVSTTGTANHLALTNGSSTLYWVTTVTSQALTATNTVTIPSFSGTIADAT